MSTVHKRPFGALVTAAVVLMAASAAVAVPAGLTLNPADAAAALDAVAARPGLHLVELAVDVLGWLALAAAGLVAGRQRGDVVAAGLLALAGAAGMLHDAGNLAVTQLAVVPGAATAATGVLLTAKWTVNLAGLLWTAATAAAAWGAPKSLRRTGIAAAAAGLAAVALPWTTGTGGPGPVLEQAGYLLHLPVMAWWVAFAWRGPR
ncbi:hypothetical protein [Glycomyces terrestris]|uniref:DUF998 domain-containing protein n=1 Tax=Glycomyces terrestris TaxID=2493553 RepID=A0A426UT41_9ACTN|nr:hypothetical protein [Glycomyces terrestris]RRR96858.1 hypothetical protein EIW28_20685 [Glycomyces terrestris]